MAKTEAIIIRVNPELKEALQKQADADQRTLSDYVRILLQNAAKKTSKQ
jgi:antitoxin component of RelBE/YafQ-DinJ toxin-antitoxin module